MTAQTFNERALVLVRVVIKVAVKGDYVNAARKKPLAVSEQRPELCQPGIHAGASRKKARWSTATAVMGEEIMAAELANNERRISGASGAGLENPLRHFRE